MRSIGRLVAIKELKDRIVLEILFNKDTVIKDAEIGSIVEVVANDTVCPHCHK